MAVEDKYGFGQNYDGFAPDTEKQGGEAPRKMSRIDRPVTKSISGDVPTDDDATEISVTVGKQMELEAGNSIKYRTCSWQKV